MDAPRPKQHLIAAARLYPKAWQHVNEMRAGRGIDLPAWPDWCYLPIAGWYSIVCADAGVPVLDHRHLKLIGDIGRLAALGTWRMTQGVYRFDPELFAALVDTPITGDLPADLFYRLPEWCVYIETPGQQWLGTDLYGFFAHMEWDANTGRRNCDWCWIAPRPCNHCPCISGNGHSPRQFNDRWPRRNGRGLIKARPP